MMLLNKMTIKARMILSFVLIALLFVLFGSIIIRQMDTLGSLTADLYEHPLKVSNAALKAKAGIISMHRNMKDVSTSQTQLSISMAIQRVQLEEKEVYRELEIIKTHILGEQGKLLAEETILMFSGWKPIRVEVEEFVLQGNTTAANQITKEKGADYVIRLERKMGELTAYALHKAEGFLIDANAVQNSIMDQALLFIGILICAALAIGFFISASILSSVNSLKATMTKISETDELIESDLIGNNEISQMAGLFNLVVKKLKDQFWLSDGRNTLNRKLSGELTYEQILTKGIEIIARYVDACAGALYAFNEKNNTCELKSSYAFVERDHLANTFKLGHGIVGQVAVEKKAILLKNITRQDVLGQSGTVSEAPKAVYAVPLFYDETLYGVLEVASFEAITPVKQKFLNSAASIVSILLNAASQNEKIKNLLGMSQKANEKLKTQTQELQAQTEELQAMNMEFQRQSDELNQQNVELEAQRIQVEEANRLKSEFLSNMSHELRTPLNSVNALSRVLILQAEEKLSKEELSYLEIIERNGKQLLSLINDILDLSKIEAGRMDIHLSRFSVKTLIENIMESIQPLADEKKITLEHELPGDLPKIESDESRILQILQNIIANGVKFTDQGSVKIFADCDEEQIRIKVADTGIGISNEDMNHIFEEFRQVDGASTRKFEGTGLGLAIAYKAARMLGGNIRVESLLGQGSSFTIELPLIYDGPKKVLQAYEKKSVAPELIQKESHGKKILIVDDEPKVLKMISEAFEVQGYETLATTSGKEAIALAREHQPFAITLDVVMPEMDGWEVLTQLKKDPLTSGIPVIIVSVSNDNDTGFALGAVGCVTKPVDRKSLITEINKIYGYLPSSVMVVDDNEFDRKQAASIITAEGIKVKLSDSGKSCLAMLEQEVPDVLVLDLVMPEMDGFGVLENLRKMPVADNLPVIIVTAKDLTPEEKQTLDRHVSSVLMKSETSSAQLIEKIRQILQKIGKKMFISSHDCQMEKNRILLIEDNEAAVIQVKNALESIGLCVDVARDGRQGLEYISHTLPKGIVLDLMMPNIDGFEVLETIRKRQDTKDIPVLILTAKDLTPKDLSRLGSNNVQQLIQKGDVDRDGLLEKVSQMIADSGPSSRSVDMPATTVKRESPVILIIEDNPDNMTTIKAVIGSGCSIKEAADGEQGLKKAIELIPDLILLDISLPVMDGITVLRELKKTQQTSQIPVVALTAQAMKGDREKLIDLGCNDYISKPIEPKLVLKTIEKYIGDSHE